MSRRKRVHTNRRFERRRPPSDEVNYTFRIPREAGEAQYPDRAIARLLGIYLSDERMQKPIANGIHASENCVGYSNYPIGMIDVHRTAGYGSAHEVRIRLYSAGAIPPGKSLDEFSSGVVNQLTGK